MAIKRTFKNEAYGLKNARQFLATPPIVSNRNPKTSDQAEIGTVWVNESTNAYYVLTGFSQGQSQWTAQATGSGTFASVEVTGGSGDVLVVDAGGNTNLGGNLAVAGNSVLSGNLTVNGNVVANGDFDITDTAAISLTSTYNGAQAIYLHANGGASETVEIRSNQGTGVNSIYLLSDAGGIVVEPNTSTSNTAFHVQANSGGYQFDAALTSQINVTGASQDIQLNATGGSIAVTATEAVAGAVTISASGATGTLILQGVGGATLETTNSPLALTSGTGSITIGADAAAHSVTIGNNTGATSVSIRGGTGAAGAISIGATANAVPVTIGNNTGATSVSIQAGTASAGAINIGTTANAVPVTIGNTTASTTVTLNTPTGTPVSIPHGINLGVYILSGTGSPNTVVTAPQGSLFLRTDGSSSSTRAYINTNSSTGWTAITTAS